MLPLATAQTERNLRFLGLLLQVVLGSPFREWVVRRLIVRERTLGSSTRLGNPSNFVHFFPSLLPHWVLSDQMYLHVAGGSGSMEGEQHIQGPLVGQKQAWAPDLLTRSQSSFSATPAQKPHLAALVWGLFALELTGLDCASLVSFVWISLDWISLVDFLPTWPWAFGRALSVAVTVTLLKLIRPKREFIDSLC